MSRAMKSCILRQFDSCVCMLRRHAVLLKCSFLSKYYKLIYFQPFSANYLTVAEYMCKSF